MGDVALHEDHTRAWYSFLIERRPMDWKALFSNYSATVDAPAAFFYREIARWSVRPAERVSAQSTDVRFSPK
jgi:hypothetical protein